MEMEKIGPWNIFYRKIVGFWVEIQKDGLKIGRISGLFHY